MFKNEENCYNKKNWITGEVQDVIIDKNGNRTELPLDHNLVVANCSTIIACMMKGEWNNTKYDGVDLADEERNGIKYWAIGTGGLDDMGALVDPSSTDTQLANEVYRKPIRPSDISFVDNNGNEVEISNRIRIKVVLDYNEANGDGSCEWSEFGVFAGPGDLSALNSGMMVNRKTHGAIAKTENIKVERTLTFTF